MPRYVIERDFPDGLIIPVDSSGADACIGVVDKNADQDVTWIHSYVSQDKKKSFCIYDGPSPEAVRASAKKTSLPISRITEVRVLDPYFYH
jgi:Nickel responsive protein SCO4226-like